MSTESRSLTALAYLHETYTDSEGEAESDSKEMAYLLETYTDSEGEAESDSDEVTHEKISPANKESSSSSMDSISFFTYASMKENKHHSKLVSYSTEAHEDDDMSDSDDSKSSSDPMEDSSSDNSVVPVGAPPLSPLSFHRKLSNLKKEEIQLPPEPVGRCSKALQERIDELFEKKRQGKDMIASLQRRKDFRNPSIYEKLIQFCDIDEHETNYPPEIYDPHRWGPESFYEELAKRQEEEMDRREKEKKERTKVEFMSGKVRPSSDSSSGSNKRKSKWDVGITQMPASVLKPASLVTPSVLPVASWTKPTVISAFTNRTKKTKSL